MARAHLLDLALADLATACDLRAAKGDQTFAAEQRLLPTPRQRRFLLFSLSKTITAVATLAACERVGLRLDAAVASVIPAFAEGGKEEVTVHDVLCHAGGFPDGRPGTPALTVADFGDPERALEVICSLPRDPALAGRGLYHPLAYGVLAHVVEDATGAAFPEFCRVAVFEPLGMRDTTWGLPPQLRAEAVPLVGPAVAGWDAMPILDAVIAAGNAWSTAADLLTLFSMLRAGGGSILSEQSVARMTSPHVPAAGQAGARAFGYGLFLGSEPGSLSGRGETASARCFGHAGYTATQAWHDPRDDVTFVALTNSCVDQNASDRRFSLLADEVRRRAS